MVVDSHQTDRLRKRLLARVQRRYATVTRPMEIGPLRFPFTRIADPDRVLDEVAEEADRRERISGRRETDEQLHLPYWAELWDSALGVAQFLVRNPPARCEAVLDLGCGMGLAGAVAAGLGAHVLLADLEPPALLFARLNSLPWRRRVRTRRLDWRTDALLTRFGLILGADILYERAQWEHLDHFWWRHLGQGGAVILGEPGRQTGDGFIDWIRFRPWNLLRHEQHVPTRAQPVRLFVLSKQEGPPERAFLNC